MPSNFLGPTLVNATLAPAVAGDFASRNPRATLPAGPGGLVAGPAGVTIANFAWVSYTYNDADYAPAAVNSFGYGQVGGFIAREQQGLITAYLADAANVIPGGMPVTLYVEGDFWVKNSTATSAQVGMKAYANYASGAVTFAATGTAPTISATGSSIAAATSSSTGSISGNVLTLTAVGSGTIYPGTTISGTSVATGTVIVSQLSGTPGGVGTYAVSIPEQTVASTTISGTYGTLTVGTTAATTWGPGQLLSGTNVVAGTYIYAFISGSGGAGTYAVNNNTVVASTTITAATAVETKWYAMSSGATGELVKISSWPMG